MKFRFYSIITGLFLLALGLVGSGYYLTGVQTAHATPAAQTVSTAVVDQSSLPTHLAIPSVKISVDIDPGYYDAATKSWTLGETKPSFATMTSTPNSEGGDTFIYGHNRKGIFDTLPKVKPGAQAIVTTADGHHFTYQMVSARDAAPNDVSLFKYQGKPILTLQTCTGLLYQHRHQVTFNLVEVS